MTGWQRFADARPDYLGFYWAWDEKEAKKIDPEPLAPWQVHPACGAGVNRPATHWHAPVAPEPPGEPPKAGRP